MLSSNFLYTVAQIRELEQLAMTQAGIPEEELMLRAGNAAFKLLAEGFPQLQSLVVVCGKGNNAGDGYEVARLAYFSAIAVTVYHLCEISELPPAAQAAANACLDAGVPMIPYTAGVTFEADVIIDALLGIGLTGEVRGLAQDAIVSINSSNAIVVAMDIPSGVLADSGAVLGTAVKAQRTLTFIGVKQGMLTGEAVNYCGVISCDDLGLTRLIETVSANALRVGLDDVAILPRRPAAHKGDFGHVLVVGGDYGMPGAVCLAAAAAARSGAGLVTVATRPEHVTAVIATRAEVMCYGINEAEQLNALLARATVCILGPGLGSSAWSQQLFTQVLAHAIPKVIDASALNLLVTAHSERDNWVLTPHPGEAARLLDCNTTQIQQDRFASAVKLQKHYGGTIVLKGAGTIIQPATGLPSLCNQGNPGMASGGMGDILSGIIGGLIAQGYSLTQAAVYGVILHANAADLAAQEWGQLSLLAGDVLAYLPDLLSGTAQHDGG